MKYIFPLFFVFFSVQAMALPGKYYLRFDPNQTSNTTHQNTNLIEVFPEGETPNYETVIKALPEALRLKFSNPQRALVAMISPYIFESGFRHFKNWDRSTLPFEKEDWACGVNIKYEAVSPYQIIDAIKDSMAEKEHDSFNAYLPCSLLKDLNENDTLLLPVLIEGESFLLYLTAKPDFENKIRNRIADYVRYKMVNLSDLDYEISRGAIMNREGSYYFTSQVVVNLISQWKLQPYLYQGEISSCIRKPISFFNYYSNYSKKKKHLKDLRDSTVRDSHLKVEQLDDVLQFHFDQPFDAKELLSKLQLLDQEVAEKFLKIVRYQGPEMEPTLVSLLVNTGRKELKWNLSRHMSEEKLNERLENAKTIRIIGTKDSRGKSWIAQLGLEEPCKGQASITAALDLAKSEFLNKVLGKSESYRSKYIRRLGNFENLRFHKFGPGFFKKLEEITEDEDIEVHAYQDASGVYHGVAERAYQTGGRAFSVDLTGSSPEEAMTRSLYIFWRVNKQLRPFGKFFWSTPSDFRFFPEALAKAKGKFFLRQIREDEIISEAMRILTQMNEEEKAKEHVRQIEMERENARACPVVSPIVYPIIVPRSKLAEMPPETQQKVMEDPKCKVQ
jgi:hypothetical protein